MRTQPPMPMLSTGIVSSVQPNRTHGRNAIAAILTHRSGGAVFAAAGDPRAGKGEAGEQDSGSGLREPMRMIGNQRR